MASGRMEALLHAQHLSRQLPLCGRVLNEHCPVKWRRRRVPTNLPSFDRKHRPKLWEGFGGDGNTGLTAGGGNEGEVPNQGGRERLGDVGGDALMRLTEVTVSKTEGLSTDDAIGTVSVGSSTLVSRKEGKRNARFDLFSRLFLRNVD
jgi:hypothetical protein